MKEACPHPTGAQVDTVGEVDLDVGLPGGGDS